MKSARNEATEPELRQDDRGYSAVRQQVNNTIPPYITFFDYAPDVFYPLLDDERIVAVFRNLMGDDFRITVTEGLIHAGGSGWHHDNVAREGYFTMRAALYLDRLGPDDGCLSVIPGSHFTQFREALGTDADQRSIRSIEKLGASAEAGSRQVRFGERTGRCSFHESQVISFRAEFEIGQAHHPHQRDTEHPAGELNSGQWLVIRPVRLPYSVA